jgi:hypothetical protein
MIYSFSGESPNAWKTNRATAGIRIDRVFVALAFVVGTLLSAMAGKSR